MSAKFVGKVVGIGAFTVAGTASVAIGMLREILRFSEQSGPGEIDLDWVNSRATSTQPPAPAADAA